ncbi:hypothetical protein [Alcanivorax sp. 1008]|uniref:hypothetical protein n=1 Tax=Alcanivorax sp. 1008 TaxID=2816853 RepID=UPI001D9C6160|nr:hypothetical protein [Alcanivorax sp. 1008]MCC1496806.1 hypothetical protein [Alcanivorax sp. 1008]
MSTDTEAMEQERDQLHQLIVQFSMRHGLDEATRLAVGTLIVLADMQGFAEMTFTNSQGEVTVLVATETH